MFEEEVEQPSFGKILNIEEKLLKPTPLSFKKLKIKQKMVGNQKTTPFKVKRWTKEKVLESNSFSITKSFENSIGVS